MLGELRLAQRQGLLTGSGLSHVQFTATQILQWSEDLAAGKRMTDQVKLALISRNDPSWVPWDLLPERIAAPTSENNDDIDSFEADYEGVDYSGVDFKGSEAIEEYEELMRQIGGLATGSLSGTELRGDDEGWV